MMAGPVVLVAWLMASFALGAALTALARAYALRRRLIDHPGERRSHAAATPRGGGLSIVLVLLLACGAMTLWWPGQAGAIGLAALGLALVAGIGWVDDHRPLSAGLRLAVHGIAGALLAAAVRLAGGNVADQILAFAAAVVLTNVWNFMDGINGLAAGQAMLVAAAYALMAGQGPVFWLGLALAAAAAGFLPFNFPRARIFLGDVGSGALGYALAGLYAGATLGGSPATRLLLLLPLLPFLLDASLTLLSRMVRGEAWWTAHVEHSYQHWARRSGHVRVSLAYAGAALLVIALMFGARSLGGAGIMFMYVMLLPAGGLSWWKLRKHRIDKGLSP